jgi:hypothetical protein
MWLLTNFGFFSIVQKEGEEQLTIRSRALEDLETLRQKYLPELCEVFEGAGTDYRYRARTSHESFAEALKKIALDIHYSNFKNSVAKEQGHGRAGIYGQVWKTLWRIDEEE